MGTMGPGLFDNDAALDMLDAAERVPLAELQGFVASERVEPEHIDAVAACVAIHMALISECGATPPVKQFAETVGDKLLHLFDQEYDRLKPAPGFKSKRRQVLADVVNRYRVLAT